MDLAVGADGHGTLDDDDLRPVDVPRPGRRRRACRARRSDEPSGASGVPTAMKMTWAAGMPSRRLVVNVSRPAATLLTTISRRPGSKIGSPPAFSVAIFLSSLSMQVTSLPQSAKQVPVTSPTYPVPMKAIFISLTPANSLIEPSPPPGGQRVRERLLEACAAAPSPCRRRSLPTSTRTQAGSPARTRSGRVRTSTRTPDSSIKQSTTTAHRDATSRRRRCTPRRASPRSMRRT